MLSSGVDLGSLFTWGHRAFTGEAGRCPSHPMDSMALNELPQSSLHHLGTNCQGDRSGCGRWLRTVSAGVLFHGAPEAQLAGQNGSLWVPLPSVGLWGDIILAGSLYLACRCQQLCCLLGGLSSFNSSLCWRSRPALLQEQWSLLSEEMQGKYLECDWFSPSSMLPAFCSIHTCWLYLIRNTAFPHWGG